MSLNCKPSQATGEDGKPVPGDALRRQTRSLENGLEASMVELSRLTAQASTAYSSSGSLPESQQVAYASLQGEIQQGLVKLDDLCGQLQSLLDADPTASMSMQHTLERHRDIMHDYTRDFKRITKSYQDAQQRANLLGSVRSEIDAFKRGDGGRDTDTDRLLNERGHIDSSHGMADTILNQAYETRLEFGRQRNMLTSVHSRMGGVIDQIPGINSVLNMINTRRRRDTFVMGGLIGFCIVILFLWATR